MFGLMGQTSLGARRGGGGFSPLSLFAADEVGAWYDRKDLTTMFVASDGIVQASADGPTGLQFDKRLGLVPGVENVTDTSFDNASAWTASSAAVSVTGGQAVFTAATGTDNLATSPAGAGVSGAMHQVTIVVDEWTSGSIAVRIKTGAITTIPITGPGTYVAHIRAGAGTATFLSGVTPFPATMLVGSFSLRELPGNHASQSTAASRPTLRAGYIELDGTDDHVTSPTGGGGTTGILIAAAIRAGGAGTARTIWSDRGTNTGYRLSINTSNQLVLSAGNGSAHTEVTGPTITAGTDYVVMGWHDGTNLNVRANLAAPTTAAFATATAGTAGFTAHRDNGAASGHFNVRDYGLIYRHNDASTSDERDNVSRYLAQAGGFAL